MYQEDSGSPHHLKHHIKFLSSNMEGIARETLQRTSCTRTVAKVIHDVTPKQTRSAIETDRNTPIELSANNHSP